MNPHLFASPRMAAQMTRSIAGQLADLDPANAATYWANAENYARTLDALADEFGALGGKLKNSRIITQHGVFDYLARDMGLDVVAVIQADDTQAPSASDMMKLINGDPQPACRSHLHGTAVSGQGRRHPVRETGVPTAKLDPVATGPTIAPLDYYEKTMRANLHTLEGTLGTN